MQRFIVLSIVLCCLIGATHAWGPEGHKIIAQIAQEHLTSQALNGVNQLLPTGYNLSSIATWPDAYDHSNGGSWSEPLHFLNLPGNATQYEASYCDNDCVVASVNNFTMNLYDSLLDGNAEFCTNYGYDDDGVDSYPQPCDLSFLVHFIGDCHQPLHTAYASDQGGNLFSVEWFGDTTNLHSIWDTKLIDEYLNYDIDSDWQTFGNEILSYFDSNPGLYDAYANSTDPVTWANEGIAYMYTMCYNFSPGTVSPPSDDLNFSTDSDWNASLHGYVNLKDPYYTRNIGIVAKRLAQAGARLATHLNGIYAKANQNESDW